MTEVINFNHNTLEPQPAKPVRTLEALLELYEQGHRNFSGSDLRGATVTVLAQEIEYLDLSKIILSGSNLTCVVFSGNTDFTINFFEADLSSCNLQGSNLTYGKFTGAHFSNCNLRGANLLGSKIDRCNFNNSDLSGAIIIDCSCLGSDFVKSILQNIQSKRSDFTASDFTKANFSRSIKQLDGNFTASNFDNANLQSVNLAGEFLQANFSQADLRSAWLVGEFLQANFSQADLRSTTLTGKFSQANFCKSNLNMATLRNLTAGGADFSDADLQVSQITSCTLSSCYYNSKTKFTECLDPVASRMKLIEDKIESSN